MACGWQLVQCVTGATGCEIPALPPGPRESVHKLASFIAGSLNREGGDGLLCGVCVVDRQEGAFDEAYRAMLAQGILTGA